jgi:alginate O-acetyltransferase complex protein AlgI
MGGYPLFNTNTIFFLRTSIVLMAISVICSTELPGIGFDRLQKKFPAAWIVISIAILILSTAYLLYSSYNPFLYFRF